MKWVKPHVLIAAASAGAVVTLAIVDAGRTSPGDLATVHGRIPELADGGGCSDCHGGFFVSSMTVACSECHEVVAAQIEAGAGLHGTLGDLAQQCAQCHSEHHGAGFPLINQRSFALAGVPDVAEFDHDLVGFAMAGKHLELACTECHEHAEAEPLPADQHRFLGLHQSCTSCHDDPHENRLGRDCLSCHDQGSFEALHRDGHDDSLPLIGGHAQLDCRTCHANETAYSLERIIGPGRRPAPRACEDCHSSPHDRRFVERNARAANLPSDASCVICHEHEHETFRAEAVELLELMPGRHAAVDFPLDGPHGDVACVDCHTPAADFVARYPGRRADDCAACHTDPHEGQFEESPLATEGCLSCHDRAAFLPHGFDARAHSRAALQLSGAHLTLDCEECHELEDELRIFRGTATSCDGCHIDVHRGAFEAHTADLEEEHGACAACHNTHTFDAAGETFDHGRWTSFALNGAHAQTTCTTCHRERPDPDRTGRTFGRIEHVFAPYQDCSTCHADPHAGSFDTDGLPATVGGRTSCARCHVESSFRALPHGFDHGRWTGFELDGAHKQAECSACHTPLRRPDKEGRTWAAAKGQRCADCHVDPHAGQFARNGKVNCARCHESTDSFARLSFHHDHDARFALGDNHAGVACSACHKPFKHAGQEIIRYRPLGTECADCHGVDSNALRRRRRGN